MIDDHRAFAGLEHEVSVAGSPLTMVVDGQKRRLDQDVSGGQPGVNRLFMNIRWYEGAFLSVNSGSKAAVSY